MKSISSLYISLLWILPGILSYLTPLWPWAYLGCAAYILLVGVQTYLLSYSTAKKRVEQLENRINELERDIQKQALSGLGRR